MHIHCSISTKARVSELVLLTYTVLQVFTRYFRFSLITYTEKHLRHILDLVLLLFTDLQMQCGALEHYLHMLASS